MKQTDIYLPFSEANNFDNDSKFLIQIIPSYIMEKLEEEIDIKTLTVETLETQINSFFQPLDLLKINTKIRIFQKNEEQEIKNVYFQDDNVLLNETPPIPTDKMFYEGFIMDSKIKRVQDLTINEKFYILNTFKDKNILHENSYFVGMEFFQWFNDKCLSENLKDNYDTNPYVMIYVLSLQKSKINNLVSLSKELEEDFYSYNNHYFDWWAIEKTIEGVKFYLLGKNVFNVSMELTDKQIIEQINNYEFIYFMGKKEGQVEIKTKLNDLLRV